MKPRPGDLPTFGGGGFKEPVDNRVLNACKMLLDDIHKNARDIKKLEAKLDRVDKLAVGLLNFAEDMFSTKKSGE